MPLPTITIVVLHEALLMVILLMLLPSISGLYRWFPYLTGLHKGPNALKNYVTKNLELFQDISNLAELPLVRYALWSKFSMITTTSRLFPTDLMFLKIPICPLTWHLMTSFLSLLFCDWSFLVPIIWPKGLFRLYGNSSFWPRFSHCQKFQMILHVLKTKRNLLFTCHYSLSLFIRYYSWHCSLRIFAYLRGVVPYVWSKRGHVGHERYKVG